MGCKKSAVNGKRADKPEDPKAEEKKKEAEEQVQRGQENVVFSSSDLDANPLIKRYTYMWGRKTEGHGEPIVLPDGPKIPLDSYPFFHA